ncbi:hypothetical protein C4D60_Mb08t05380 [Musa balbisiana]|uniref:Uncharacterized protein n=1 Tax=Musa balbisiana TaxID=52838 RepID=A0A4S8K1I3_MUSBA|nr:hypothetical protein C4D60_Mb08t05380 [Musa balbisiana]
MTDSDLEANVLMKPPKLQPTPAAESSELGLGLPLLPRSSSLARSSSSCGDPTGECCDIAGSGSAEKTDLKKSMAEALFPL